MNITDRQIACLTYVVQNQTGVFAGNSPYSANTYKSLELRGLVRRCGDYTVRATPAGIAFISRRFMLQPVR